MKDTKDTKDTKMARASRSHDSRSQGYRYSGRRNVRIASRNASPKSAAFRAPMP